VTVTDSDSDLIRRAQADDIDAFCLLAERYARRITAATRRMPKTCRKTFG
jgi:hypothetical protein